MERINFNFISISNDNVFNILNNNLQIEITDVTGLITFQDTYVIKYEINNNLNKKYYFIEVNDLDVNNLTKNNISINLASNYIFFYNYYNNENKKSIIICTLYNYYKLNFLGLPNLKDPLYIQIDYEYYSISNINNDIYNITLFNNATDNLQLIGDIYKINILGITDFDNNNNYKLFKINDNIILNQDTEIYFYNDISLFSYVIYLNSYNFRVTDNNNETIILLIEYVNNNENVDDLTGYSSVLSLNLQNFSSLQIMTNENEFYNTLFFYNYINKNYNVKSITIFNFDYKKYFIDFSNNSIKKNPEFYNIDDNCCYNNLYNLIIQNDSYLEYPIILDVNYLNLLINIDLINLLNLIRFESENNYFYKITKSGIINIDIIIEYLINFQIKKYNIYKINNIYISNNKNFYKNNNIKNIKNIININNNITNCIRCKIIFFYKNYETYSFDGKIFLDNYNIQVYHKKYEFENINTDMNKKKLINMLLFLATLPDEIKIIFYYNNLNININYVFNQISLKKIKNEFSIFFDITPINNLYQNQNLKFNLNINKDYYILFLYSDISYYNELIFTYTRYIFKIIKIDIPNGNLYENKELYYISFQSLKELNIFMNYIKTGIFNINPEYISNYFNFNKSQIFCNYYNINNYWVLNSLPIQLSENINVQDKNEIIFSINNLNVNQVFLYGELFIKKIN